jgi:hypothetical protein
MTPEILELLGYGAAARLTLALGGREIRVPVRHQGRTWEALVQAIGAEAAARFCGYFQGERIYVASSQKLHTERNRAAVAKLRAQGKSWADVSRVIGYTERGARKLLEKRPGRAAEAMLDALKEIEGIETPS